MMETEVAVRQPMEIIAAGVTSGMDSEQLEKLMALQERHETNEARREYSEALAAFQADCPPIQKTRKTDRSKYASFDDIMLQIRPSLAKHGLSVTFDTEVAENGITVVCNVSKGVHVQATKMTIPLPSQMKVNDAQMMGAAFSYAKRYAITAALNLIATDIDDDAWALNEPKISTQQLAEIQRLYDLMPESSQAKMLEWARIDSLEEMPKKKFEKAKKAMLAKVEEVCGEDR